MKKFFDEFKTFIMHGNVVISEAVFYLKCARIVEKMIKEWEE